MEPIPIIGNFYHFWDDGKTSPSRHYIAKVEQIISLDEAKNLFTDTEDEDGEMTTISLYDAWRIEKTRCDFLYAQETECFIKCSIPKYDDEPIYFVRTKDGGWFSIDFSSWWQGGRLDVTGDKYKSIIEYYENNKEYDNTEFIKKYKEQTY